MVPGPFLGKRTRTSRPRGRAGAPSPTERRKGGRVRPQDSLPEPPAVPGRRRVRDTAAQGHGASEKYKSQPAAAAPKPCKWKLREIRRRVPSARAFPPARNSVSQPLGARSPPSPATRHQPPKTRGLRNPGVGGGLRGPQGRASYRLSAAPGASVLRVFPAH